MKNPFDNPRRSGIFTIGPDREIYGNLSLDGPNVLLHVWDRDFLNIDLSLLDGIITGILDDQTKISLIRCHVTGPRINYRGGQASFCYTILPHYVICGDQHFSDTDENISQISFLLDDVAALFSGTDAFGAILNQREALQQLVRSEYPQREIILGDDPWIAYYTGKSEIFSSNTVFGKVSARHSPTFRLGGPEGTHIENKIFFNITFDQACKIDDAFSQMWKVAHFLGLMAGRAQNFVEIKVHAEEADHESWGAYVYASTFAMRQPSEGIFGDTSSMDPLINAANYPDKFAQVLSKWLEKDSAWSVARLRFADGWKKNWNYDANRLVRSANIFNILPKDEFPIAGTPKRVGKLSLRRRICHRAQILEDKVGQRIPDLKKVINEAVKCRDLYVHGTPPRSGLSYKEYETEQIFLTNTLEFIFAASELVEAGWDIEDWCEGTYFGHPFGRYLSDYAYHFHQLQSTQDECKLKVSDLE